jgi:Ca2+-binding EF-hand superfamily protein
MNELKSLFQGKLELGSEVMDDRAESRSSRSSYAGQDENEIWKMIIKQADTDHDGKISKEEFRAAMIKVIDHRSSMLRK